MDSIIQYSVILLRDDPNDDLPGAPVSELPLVFSDGLESGEPVFAKDSGRMFVGHEPTPGQINFQRVAHPYQNIEVLTECSTGLFSRMVEEAAREYVKSPTHVAQLVTTATSKEVEINAGGSSVPYRIEDVSSVAMTLNYTAFASDGRPVRSGDMYIMHGKGMVAPIIIDQGQGSTSLEFSAKIEGPVGHEYIMLCYRNQTGYGELSLRFTASRPTFERPTHRNRRLP